MRISFVGFDLVTRNGIGDLGDMGSRVLRFTALALAVSVVACGENSPTPAGSGASGGMGAGGQGNGATAGTAAASGGAAGFPPCPAGLLSYGASDIDLTLGGLNADLPAPSRDCLSVAPSSSLCAALTVELAGAQRDVVCTQPVSSAADGSSLSCTSGSNTVTISTKGFGGKKPPTTFALGPDALPHPLELELPEGTFGRSDAPAVTAAQVNGWVNLFYDSYGCNNTMYGVIAVTMPDNGSGVLRARGSFQSRQFFH